MKTIRWGIIGAGYIANEFSKAMKVVENSVVYGVASRNIDKAKKFQEQYNINKAFGSYEELVKCDEIDAVYIATLHPFHKENMLLCLKYNKHVMCEKPITMNASEIEEVMKVAKEKKLLVMEAMWTRFLPVLQEVKEKIDSGIIGDVNIIQGDFGFNAEYNDEGRVYNKKLGGGALLDVGIYVISMAYFFYNKKPSKINAFSHIGPTGVDHKTAIIFAYDNNNLAQLSCSVSCNTNTELILNGTKGRIYIPKFFGTQKYELEVYGELKEAYELPFKCNGHEYIIEEFNDCLRNNKTDNEIIPSDETIQIMKTIDEIMTIIGLNY